MTELDYSPLSSKVTRHEVVQYMRSTGRSPRWISTVFPYVIGAVLTTIIAAVYLGSAYADRRGSIGPGLFIAGFVVITVAIWVYAAKLIIRDKKREPQHILLSRFATANGLTFTRTSSAPDYPGMIFDLGSDRKAHERVSRTTLPSLDLGNYEYTVRAGKHSRTFRWGFMAIRLDRRLPHMVLDAKSNNTFGSNLPIGLAKDQVLPLEGQFDQHFTLHCPKEYERDALYVFTPDLMAHLMDHTPFLDIEIIDDWMFFYSYRHFALTDGQTISRMFWIADNVGSKAASRSERYADDRVPADSTSALSSRLASNAIAPAGLRLKRHFPWGKFFLATGIAALAVGSIAGITLLLMQLF